MLAVAVLLAAFPLALVPLALLLPAHHALAVLRVGLPLAIVHRARRVHHHAAPVLPVALPLAGVARRAVGVVAERPLARALPRPPLALVRRRARARFERAGAVAQPVLHLARVRRAVGPLVGARPREPVGGEVAGVLDLQRLPLEGALPLHHVPRHAARVRVTRAEVEPRLAGRRRLVAVDDRREELGLERVARRPPGEQRVLEREERRRVVVRRAVEPPLGLRDGAGGHAAEERRERQRAEPRVGAVEAARPQLEREHRVLGQRNVVVAERDAEDGGLGYGERRLTAARGREGDEQVLALDDAQLRVGRRRGGELDRDGGEREHALRQPRAETDVLDRFMTSPNAHGLL